MRGTVKVPRWSRCTWPPVIRLSCAPSSSWLAGPSSDCSPGSMPWLECSWPSGASADSTWHAAHGRLISGSTTWWSRLPPSTNATGSVSRLMTHYFPLNDECRRRGRRRSCFLLRQDTEG